MKSRRDALHYQIMPSKSEKGSRQSVRLLKAVIRSVAQKGFDATTFDSVGKIVGMHRAHVNYYFLNRDQMFMSAVKLAVSTGQSIIIRELAGAKTEEDRLRAVIKGNFVWLEENPDHAAVMMTFYSLCVRESIFRKLQTQISEAGYQRIEACLSSLPKGKRRRVASSIQALITGRLVMFFTSPSQESLETLRIQTIKESQIIAHL